MDLLIQILSGISVPLGFSLFFSPARGSFIAGVIMLGAGVIALDSLSFVHLVTGFVLLWVMRLIGLEGR